MAAACRHCGTALPGRLPGPHTTCSRCKQDGVRDEHTGRRLATEAKDAVRLLGLALPAGRPTVQLVPRSSLPEGHLGTTASQVGPFGVHSVVSIELGMPPDATFGVCAHELGHTWLHHERLLGLTRATEEGFCELVAALALEPRGTPMARFLVARAEANPDPTYGGGYRAILALHRAEGMPGVLRRIRDVADPGFRGRRVTDGDRRR
jgi:hypothetical protein